jgi:type III pantothenate kinase
MGEPAIGEPVRLLLDMGNSAVKWRIAELNGEAVMAGRSAADTLGAHLAAALNGRRVVEALASSVASRAASEWVAALCQRQFGVEARFVAVVDGARGLRCGYVDPAKLGVDRWLAMLAARQRYGGTLVVVDVGSAATFDVVDGDRHLGGYILPGLNLMRVALAGGTDAVKVPAVLAPVAALGCSTADAVNSGGPAALRALALQLAEQYQARIIVGGGDGPALCAGLAAADNYPEMVLDGLQLAAAD